MVGSATAFPATVPGLETSAARALAVDGLTGVAFATEGAGFAAGLSVLALPSVLLGVAVEDFFVSAFFSSSFFFKAGVTLAVDGLNVADLTTPLADNGALSVATAFVTGNLPAPVFPATPFVLTSLTGA